MKASSSSTLFIKVVKIIHKQDRLLRYAKPFSKFFRISNALKQQWFPHQVEVAGVTFSDSESAPV